MKNKPVELFCVLLLGLSCPMLLRADPSANTAPPPSAGINTPSIGGTNGQTAATVTGSNVHFLGTVTMGPNLAGATSLTGTVSGGVFSGPTLSLATFSGYFSGVNQLLPGSETGIQNNSASAGLNNYSGLWGTGSAITGTANGLTAGNITTAAINALGFAPTAFTVSASGTTVLSGSTLWISGRTEVEVAAGSGVYGYTIVLSDSNVVPGAIFRIGVDYDASFNGTLNIIDANSSDLMFTGSNAFNGASYLYLQFGYDGTRWHGEDFEW